MEQEQWNLLQVPKNEELNAGAGGRNLLRRSVALRSKRLSPGKLLTEKVNTAINQADLMNIRENIFHGLKTHKNGKNRPDVCSSPDLRSRKVRKPTARDGHLMSD